MKNSFNLQLQLSPAGDNSPKKIIIPGKRRCRKSELLKVTLGIMRSFGLETMPPPPPALVGGTSRGTRPARTLNHRFDVYFRAIKARLYAESHPPSALTSC